MSYLFQILFLINFWIDGFKIALKTFDVYDPYAAYQTLIIYKHIHTTLGRGIWTSKSPFF